MQKRLKILVFLWLITTIIITTFTISKYQTTIQGSSSAKVAAPIITMSSSTLQVKMNPIENEQEYIFSVSNTDEQKTSEVTMEYTLEILNQKNLPLEFELYTYEQQIQGDTNLLNGNITQSKIMNYEEEIVDTYLLKIKWKETEKSYKYSTETDFVQIILNASQVD